MKLLSFTRRGACGFGCAHADGVIDLTGRLGADILTLQDALTHDVLDLAAAYADGRAAEFGWSDIAFLPVIPTPAKILCVGVNYAKHLAEMNRPETEQPLIFTRFADTQVGHLQPLIKPSQSDRFDYEGEMAVVIGRGGRNIPEARALEHVAGYACYNDGSVRDWQRHTSQFTPGKNFSGTGAFGPCLTTADEIDDYRTLPIETRLNGEVMQSASLADLIFPVERLIAYLSTFTPLSPGDVIVTGTPGGVGDKREPPVYMQPGDQVEVEIGPLDVLSNPVRAESAL